MKVTEENIFLEHESLLGSMGRVPTTTIRNCLKVSVMWNVKLRKVAILVTGLGPEGQMLSTAVHDKGFGGVMTELEDKAYIYKDREAMVGYSIGREGDCPKHIKDRVHAYLAHRVIFLNLRDLPLFLADLNYRDMVKRWRKENVKLKFTRMMALDALEAVGNVLKL